MVDLNAFLFSPRFTRWLPLRRIGVCPNRVITPVKWLKEGCASRSIFQQKSSSPFFFLITRHNILVDHGLCWTPPDSRDLDHGMDSSPSSRSRNWPRLLMSRAVVCASCFFLNRVTVLTHGILPMSRYLDEWINTVERSHDLPQFSDLLFRARCPWSNWNLGHDAKWYQKHRTKHLGGSYKSSEAVQEQGPWSSFRVCTVSQETVLGLFSSCLKRYRALGLFQGVLGIVGLILSWMN